MDIPLWLQIIIQIGLIALNAVFACAEIAVIEAKGPKLDKLADDGNKRARKLKRLSDNPAKFLATIQVAITLAGFLGSAFAAEGFSGMIVDALDGKVALSRAALNTLSVIVITIVLSFVTLVFGELVPKRIAMRKAEFVALKLTGTIRFISVIFAPLVWLLTVSTNGVLRLLRINPHEEDEKMSEDDIRMLADAGSEKGVIDEETNEIIQNVFEFDDITVGEIATHRTELKVLYLEDSDEEWFRTVRDDVHTYYPVCDEDIDHIVGMLDEEVYLRLDDRSRENVMKQAVIAPHYVTQVMKTDALFREMKREHSNIAIVIDEYGGTYGLVTMNDLIQQIIGEFDTEETEADAVPSGDGYLIAGSAEREKIDELFDVETGTDSATVSGWVMEQLEKIPEEGDEVISEGVKLKVTKADDKRVLEVYVEKLPQDEEDAEEERESRKQRKAELKES